MGSKTNPAAGGKRPLGIYLHIPFCKKKCLYCDFLSAPAADCVVERYVEALCAQIAREAGQYKAFCVRTVFFGGGTPSLLTPLQIERIMDCLRAHFVTDENAEVTMESNPGTLDESSLLGYRRAGINRLSIGLQSADDAALKALGRIHDYETFCQNYEAARRAGFLNINVDLMSALPGQGTKDWIRTLRKVAALSPEHISAYSLMIEEGTPFYERYGGDFSDGHKGQNGNDRAVLNGVSYPPLPSEEEERQMYEATERILGEYGYHRYEISNYAKEGYECLHNTGYWERIDYAGFGLGASSLADNVRWKATDDLQAYLRCFQTAVSAAGEAADAKKAGIAAPKDDWKEEVHRLSRAEQMEEFMFLGLRLTRGISAAAFRRQFGVGIREIYGKVLQKLEEENLICFYEDGKRMKLTSRGVDISNYVLAQFLLDGEC